MINARELRIGNLVTVENDYENIQGVQTRIAKCCLLGVNKGVWQEYKDIKPIPLTEEWLIKFGFDCFDGGIITSYSIDVTGITMAKSEVISLTPNNDRNGYWYVYFRQGDTKERELFHTHDLVLLQRKLEYVHQLQNLFFALTGKELTINNNNE